MLPSTLPFIDKQKKSADQSFFIDVGRDLSRRISPGSIMIDRTPHLPFYSGAIRTSPPYAEVDDVIGFCKTRGIRYWVVSTFYVPSLRPQFSSLLDPGRAPDGIKPVAIYNAGGNHRIIIYEILTA